MAKFSCNDFYLSKSSLIEKDTHLSKGRVVQPKQNILLNMW